MEKSEELKKKLENTFSNKRNWNRPIAIDGETYRYTSAMNQIGREVIQPSGAIWVMVGCFLLDIWDGPVRNDRPKNFIWCC